MLTSLAGCAALLVAMAGSLGVSPVDADQPAEESAAAQPGAAEQQPTASEGQEARPSGRRERGRSRRDADRDERSGPAKDTFVVENCLVTLIADVEIPAQVEGQVEQIAVREGTPVEKGQQIARIDDSQAKLRVEAAEARLDEVKLLGIRLDGAKLEAEQAHRHRVRVSQLREREVISESEVSSAEFAATRASSRVREAEQELEVANRVGRVEVHAAVGELERTRIMAPIDGIVIERYLDEGEWVKRGDPVCRMIKMDRLRALATLSARECDPRGLKPGLDVEIVVESRRPGGKETTVPGKIVFVNPVMTVGTRFEVWAEFDNLEQKGGWVIRPGQSATLLIKRGEAEERGQQPTP